MITRRHAIQLGLGRNRRARVSAAVAKLAYLEDNLAASRGLLPDEKTRAKMIALLESA